MSESLTIGIPAYNERDNIEAAVREAQGTGRRSGLDFEILVVDDASRDGTGEVLERLAREIPELRVVRHPENRGIVAAFQSLYDHTRRELLFMNAADHQWKMDEVFPMLEALRRDRLDLVVGRRVDKQYTAYRKLISHGFRIMTETLFGVPVWDPGSIKLMREPIRRIPVVSTGVFEQAERIIRAHHMGYRVGHVDVAHLPRTAGKAGGASWRNVRSAVTELFRFYAAYRRGLGRAEPTEPAAPANGGAPTTGARR